MATGTPGHRAGTDARGGTDHPARPPVRRAGRAHVAPAWPVLFGLRRARHAAPFRRTLRAGADATAEERAADLRRNDGLPSSPRVRRIHLAQGRANRSPATVREAD